MVFKLFEIIKDKIRVHTDLKFERRPRPLRKDPQIPRHIALPFFDMFFVFVLLFA